MYSVGRILGSEIVFCLRFYQIIAIKYFKDIKIKYFEKRKMKSRLLVKECQTKKVVLKNDR